MDKNIKYGKHKIKKKKLKLRNTFVGSLFSDWVHRWMRSRPSGPITMNFVKSELKSWALMEQRFVRGLGMIE